MIQLTELRHEPSQAEELQMVFIQRGSVVFVAVPFAHETTLVTPRISLESFMFPHHSVFWYFSTMLNKPYVFTTLFYPYSLAART